MGFFLEYLKKPKMVGAVAPSSRFLAAKMLRPVDFSKARTIVELGAGTGVFTRQILKRMHPGARLFVFEIHPLFVRQLEGIADKRMKIIAEPAEQLRRHVQHADAIISSLPLIAFPEKTVRHIIDEAKCALKPGGVYVQFQYGLKSYSRLKQAFSEVSLDFTPLNIPPAFVYRCKA